MHASFFSTVRPMTINPCHFFPFFWREQCLVHKDITLILPSTYIFNIFFNGITDQYCLHWGFILGIPIKHSTDLVKWLTNKPVLVGMPYYHTDFLLILHFNIYGKFFFITFKHKCQWKAIGPCFYSQFTQAYNPALFPVSYYLQLSSLLS